MFALLPSSSFFSIAHVSFVVFEISSSGHISISSFFFVTLQWLLPCLLFIAIVPFPTAAGVSYVFLLMVVSGKLNFANYLSSYSVS
jgi:hypothetical protein